MYGYTYSGKEISLHFISLSCCLMKNLFTYVRDEVNFGFSYRAVAYDII